MSETKAITMKVNGSEISRKPSSSGELLVDFLRNELNLTGTKEACGVGVCGLCTVWLDGQTTSSCITPAVAAEATEIYTSEGLEGCRGQSCSGSTSAYAPDPVLWETVQQAFVECEGMQCGICTPGQVMSALGLLSENPNPTDEEIEHYMAGNLCRCTGYQSIVRAVRLAAERWENSRASV